MISVIKIRHQSSGQSACSSQMMAIMCISNNSHIVTFLLAYMPEKVSRSFSESPHRNSYYIFWNYYSFIFCNYIHSMYSVSLLSFQIYDLDIVHIRNTAQSTSYHAVQFGFHLTEFEMQLYGCMSNKK